jgi:PKD repeat protein
MTFRYFFAALAILALTFTSCQKEPEIGDIQADIDGYSVSFTVDVRNADTYLWDFGDNTTSTEESPVHEYQLSGTYTVTLTVSGKGGESMATAQIEIEPSVSEMLTGGAGSAGGKTWVLSPGYTAGVEGGGAIDNSLQVILPSVANMLEAIGLGDEYDNEYTFHSDGRYSVDVKNGIALVSGIYGTVTGTTVDLGNESNNLGIYGGTYTAPASATWTLHEEDLVVDAITNPLGTEVPAPHAMVTISGRKWVSLSEGAFFGVLDFPSTRKFIIKEITPDKMVVAIFICGYLADENAWSIPAYLFHLTYVPKQ